jgi:hypothetical protein
VNYHMQVRVGANRQLPENSLGVAFGRKTVLDNEIVTILKLSWYGRSFCAIFYNGTAIKGVCVNRREHRAESWYFSRETVTVQGGYGACFCSHGRSFVELEPFRGTRYIGARNLSPVTKLMAGTGAVSRYNLYRSQKIIKVQKLS